MCVCVCVCGVEYRAVHYLFKDRFKVATLMVTRRFEQPGCASCEYHPYSHTTTHTHTHSNTYKPATRTLVTLHGRVVRMHHQLFGCRTQIHAIPVSAVHQNSGCPRKYSKHSFALLRFCVSVYVCVCVLCVVLAF